MHRETVVSRTTTLLMTGLALGFVGLTFAQYGGGYPYSRPPATSRRLTNSELIGGFAGNPYRNNRGAPSGLPISGVQTHNFFGTGGGGGSLAHRPVQKPFSNLSRPRPLITSQEAARIEVARGLWRY